MANIRKVYLGSCHIAGEALACTNMTAGLELRPNFFDHVIGKLDTTGSSKGKGGSNEIQKVFWRYAPGVAKISVSGVGTEGALSALLNAAYRCIPVNASCSFSKTGSGNSIAGGYISQLTIDCRAGENITFSVEVVGKELSSSGGGSALSCRRLANWTSIQVASGVGNEYVGFSLTITNPIKPVFTSANGFLPDDIRIGMQEITGSVSCTTNNVLVGPEDSIHISSRSCGGFSQGFRCVFDGTKNTGDVGGIFVATTNFTVVTK